MMGRYKEAYYDYKKALELEPNFTHGQRAAEGFRRHARAGQKCRADSEGVATAGSPGSGQGA